MRSQSQQIIWNDENQDKLIKELIKLVSKQVKEDQWFHYNICFKKCKNGELIIRNPESKEL